MLGAKLRYLNTGINMLHYLIIYPIHFVAKNQGVFFILFGTKLVQHGTVFSLLNSDDNVPAFAEMSNRVHRSRKMVPGNRLRSTQGRFLYFTIRRQPCYPAKAYLLHREGIRS